MREILNFILQYHLIFIAFILGCAYWLWHVTCIFSKSESGVIILNKRPSKPSGAFRGILYVDCCKNKTHSNYVEKHQIELKMSEKFYDNIARVTSLEGNNFCIVSYRWRPGFTASISKLTVI